MATPSIPSHPPTTATVARLLWWATHASVATAVVLMIAKFGAWVATGSISLLAALIDSSLDAGASLINLLAVRWSLRPPDDKHRFGYGKAQALAALGQATFIAGSALFFALHALDRLLHPRPLTATETGVWVMLFSIVLTLGLLLFQRHVIRRTGSTAIKADAMHYATDLATNGATIAALLFAQFGLHGADPLFGLAIGGYVLYSAFQIGWDAVQLLLDRELPEPQRQHILALAHQVPQVLGVHDLRTRQSGQSLIIQLHLELDDSLLLIAAHQIAAEVEMQIRAYYPDSDIIIHQDPASLGDEQDHAQLALK
ncbi:cation diffusion facilitator family transporter [Rhodoferax sp. 4810]|uniref:Cation-efflux pump FieF n=1 Tax=Thiospirillum jenense TaxID=1653858 RepID=A0A839HF93_9GAMM|nr:cation diffusion facilitator family transporter [Thiospirillum jenense]MBB1073337.1 cation diffusion facilitator family transporter [Rhodoferax jenense]MBB1125689.1 cation diffusion facilitator family transporter [Thiospirillum jenense]